MGRFDWLSDILTRSAYVRTTPNDDGGILLNTPDGWVSDQVMWTSGAGGARNPVWWIGNDQWGGPMFGNASTILPALSRAVSLISEPIGAMPIRVVDVEQQETVKPLPRWLEDPMLARPDERFATGAIRRVTALTRTELYASTVASCVLRGNGFWTFGRGADGMPMAGTISAINPAYVTPDTTSNPGRVEYDVNGVKTINGVLPVGPGLEVMHFRGIPPYDENGWGYGVLDRHLRALGLAQSVRDYAGSQMVNGVPPGFLKVSNPNLSKTQADDLKAKWMETYGSSSRSIAVLNATTDFQAVNLTPVDAQMIDMMKMSLLDVALACGVEPSMLGVSADSNTYANVESRQIQFQTFSLLPYVSRMEDTLSAYLPQGRRVDIVMRALLRADSQTRIDGYAQALRDGWMNRNEVRVLEGMEPIDGGDEFDWQKEDRQPAQIQDTRPDGSLFTDNKSGVATLAAPRNSNPEKVA